MLVDLGLFIVRLVVGVVLVAHGLQKFGFLGGNGLVGMAAVLEKQGFRPGQLWALAVGLAETVGGALLILGFLGPLGPMLIVADLLVAMLVVHWPRGFFSQGGGIEFTFVLVGASIAIALLGFGSWSADAVIGVVVPAWLTLAALALAIVAVVISLLVRNGSSRSAAT